MNWRAMAREDSVVPIREGLVGAYVGEWREKGNVAHAAGRSGEDDMITEFVQFALPEGISRQKVVEGMRSVAPKWRANPQLIRKTFVYDPQANEAGAFYLWKNRAAAEAAHDEEWRQGVIARYGHPPRIRYFETPVVVDNLVGETIEE
jgi:hypothetical protein